MNSFTERADYFVKIYENIIAQNEIAKKTLVFMDDLSNFAKF